MSKDQEALFESNLTGLELVGRGKVRDIFEIDREHLLIVASDRISAFDVVLPNPIPSKGRVLTAISNYWFAALGDIVTNHLTGLDPESFVASESDKRTVHGRAVVVKRLRPLPIEAVVRGYLIGSGWKDYCASGAVCGIDLPKGLELADRLSEPIFTPSTKAKDGAHDENITERDTVRLIGEDLTRQIRQVSLTLYTQASEHARKAGIIIADTKFEFGLDAHDDLVLIDELLTPDSSRFWPAETYQPGASPPSFDKQYVRDYLENQNWNKRPPAPDLPDVIIKRTTDKYVEALSRLTGRTLE